MEEESLAAYFSHPSVGRVTGLGSPSNIDQITAPCFAIKFDTVRPPTPSSLSSFYHKEAAQGKSLIGFGLNRGFSGACHYIIEKIS